MFLLLTPQVILWIYLNVFGHIRQAGRIQRTNSSHRRTAWQCYRACFQQHCKSACLSQPASNRSVECFSKPATMYNIAAENDGTAVTYLERHRVQYEAKGSNKTIFLHYKLPSNSSTTELL